MVSADTAIVVILTLVNLYANMSFQNFDSFQAGQHPAADAAAGAPGAPAPADTAMTGQADPSTAPFQGPAPGEPSAAAVPQQGNEGKTTLWYVHTSLNMRQKRLC